MYGPRRSEQRAESNAERATNNEQPTNLRELQSRAEQSRAEQSRAEQSRAEQSRAEQSRAEQSRAESHGSPSGEGGKHTVTQSTSKNPQCKHCLVKRCSLRERRWPLWRRQVAADGDVHSSERPKNPLTLGLSQAHSEQLINVASCLAWAKSDTFYFKSFEVRGR